MESRLKLRMELNSKNEELGLNFYWGRVELNSQLNSLSGKRDVVFYVNEIALWIMGGNKVA